ncbi:HNH endonuclease family protein [Cellulomonas sp. 73-145]|uniref:HNH endonuclease family protein n=1 Tax=Cellulomonas sp. 73-145 TaxID=1895739 RepID=UPI0025C48F9E|nr:HNH endonuclease family protein [Cellulomonas sp. 73-145]
MTVRAAAPPAAAAGRRPARRGRAGALVVALFLVGIGVAAATAAPHTEPTATRTGMPSPTATDRPSTARAADSSTALPAGRGRGALVALAALRVNDSPTRAGYQRDLFGYRAVDLDRNGCDTRNDILRRDLHDVVLKPGTNDCVVLSGTLTDPYSGTTIAFTRGTNTSNDVQIDHVVALADAWASGASAWDQTTRYRLGNDPLNLLAVSGPLNTQKSDGDAAQWLPPNVAYRCTYVARQVGVKYTYGLTVTTAERRSMAGVLAGCPDQPLPPGSTLPAPAAG